MARSSSLADSAPFEVAHGEDDLHTGAEQPAAGRRALGLRQDPADHRGGPVQLPLREAEQPQTGLRIVAHLVGSDVGGLGGGGFAEQPEQVALEAGRRAEGRRRRSSRAGRTRAAPRRDASRQRPSTSSTSAAWTKQWPR